MNKLNELQTIKNIVLLILEHDPKARNSDSYLYLKVLKGLAAAHGIDLSQITVPEFFSQRPEIFPSIETVGRARRKAQAERPELRPSDKVAAAREVNEQAFFDFARGR